MANVRTDELELEDFSRFSDLTEEPMTLFTPIYGLEQMPIVTIDRAIEPLRVIIPEIDQMLKLVKENRRELKDGLTSDESASIMLFSMDWQPKEESIHRLLNRNLCDENRDRLKPWYHYLKLFQKALGKLPSVSCYVYRGAEGDLTDQYPQGKIFLWWAYSFCTRSIETLESDHYADRLGHRTRFRIECKTGKDIRHHSFQQINDQILLLSAQRYKVISSIDSSQGLHIIQVKEMDPNLTSSSSGSDRTSSMSLSLTQRKASIAISIRDTSFCSVVLKLTGSSSVYHNPHLEDLLSLSKPNSVVDLSVRELINQDMSIIVQRAICDKQCTGLYLTGNKFSNNSLSILTDALYNNHTLVELDLSDNHISDYGVKILIDGLSTNKSSLQKCHLGLNQITDQGVQYLSTMLQTNHSLTHLMLNRNQISNHGVEILSTVLALYNRSLQVLSLAFNNLINDSSVEYFIQMLEQNSTLKGLDLKGCNMSDLSNERLRQAIHHKTDFELFTNTVNQSCILS